MSTKDKDSDKNEAETAAASQVEDSAPEATEAATEAAADDADDVGGREPASAPDSGGSDQDGGHDAPPAEQDGEPRELFGLLAEFDTPGELIAAAEKVRDAGYTEWDSYCPFPVHGIDAAMGIKRTVLPWIVFIIGLCGLGGGLLLQWWTNAYNWPWIVSGKPFFSLPANIPVTFETTILAAVFASFFGMWALNKLPQVWHPFFRKERFLRVTDDSFFIGIQASDRKFQRGKTETLLRDAGAIAVETCYTSAEPDRRRLPRPLTAFIVVSAVLALVPLALVAKARTSRSAEPRIHVFPDMDFQPKYGAQDGSALFDDLRVSRLPVEGTVARGQLKSDDQFYRGVVRGEWTTAFPATFEVSERTMARGKERYDIYCEPCHGSGGNGDGIIHERTKKLAPANRALWVQPTSLHQDYVVRLPHGQLYNTISKGIRTMPPYAAQISEWDRWAIVLYVRALQRSQRANLDDVPPEMRDTIQ
jgi:mono/diheme cytochrome c family protein